MYLPSGSGVGERAKAGVGVRVGAQKAVDVRVEVITLSKGS